MLFVESNELQRHHYSMCAAWTSGGETTLKSLHFHLWQNSRLLGLSTVRLPTTLLLGDKALQALAMTKHMPAYHSYFPLVFRSYWRCAPIHQPELRIDNPFNSLLLSADVEVSSLSSGEAIGLLQVALYVGPGSLKAPSQLLGPTFGCFGVRGGS